jgi:predicted GIY-YIG superfamily endonuclease
MKITFYKITLIENPEYIYIGSCKNFNRRKFQHKKNTTNKVGKSYWTDLYIFIRLNQGWDAFHMEKLYDFECENTLERQEYEQAIIDKLRPKLNKVRALKDKKCLNHIMMKLI